MNLDALKADIANNEIRVLVNGQPELLEYSEWCRTVCHSLNVGLRDFKEAMQWMADGNVPIAGALAIIYSQLDY